MPKHIYTMRLQEYFSPKEQRLVQLVLALVNDLRGQLGLSMLTEADIETLMRAPRKQAEL